MKMECSICGYKTRGIDVRSNKEGVRVRVRECQDETCGVRETTYELSQTQVVEELDKVLPIDLVDQISWAVDLALPERENEEIEQCDFYILARLTLHEEEAKDENAI